MRCSIENEKSRRLGNESCTPTYQELAEEEGSRARELAQPVRRRGDVSKVKVTQCQEEKSVTVS